MPTKEVKIRPMTDADLASVNAIDRMLAGDARVTTWPFSFETYWAVHQPKVSLVAETSEGIAGFVVGNIVPAENSQSVLAVSHAPEHKTQHKRVGWIDMLGIDPEAQGEGIGRKLVEAFANECKRADAAVKGIARIDDEMLKSFFTSVGFKPSNLMVYEKE